MYGSVSSGLSTSGMGNGLLGVGVGAGEHFCLRWNDYEKKYAETFRILRDDEYFTDVTLATEENHSVKAHRVILSACSNYFHAILKTMSPWERPVLLLDNVRAADLDSLMDFIYFGQVSYVLPITEVPIPEITLYLHSGGTSVISLMYSNCYQI
jgi:hypothetical protein